MPPSAGEPATTPASDFTAGPHGAQIHTLGVGDTFLGMELTQLRDNSHGEDVEWGFSATWQGNITLSGTLDIGVSEMYPDHFVTMILNKESFEKLPFPVAILELAPNGFLVEFTNTPEELTDLIGMSHGDDIPCEITISHYYIFYIIFEYEHSLTMTGFTRTDAPGAPKANEDVIPVPSVPPPLDSVAVDNAPSLVGSWLNLSPQGDIFKGFTFGEDGVVSFHTGVSKNGGFDGYFGTYFVQSNTLTATFERAVDGFGENLYATFSINDNVLSLNNIQEAIFNNPFADGSAEGLLGASEISFERSESPIPVF